MTAKRLVGSDDTKVITVRVSNDIFYAINDYINTENRQTSTPITKQSFILSLICDKLEITEEPNEK